MENKNVNIILKLIYFFIIISIIILFIVINKNHNNNDETNTTEDYIILNYGDTYSISPNKKDENLIWSSSNTNLISVDDNGNLFINSNTDGEATITLSDENGKKIETFKIKVNKIEQIIEPTGITLDKKEIILNYGQKTKIKAEISPKNVTDKNINWTSNNVNLVTVDNFGNIEVVNNQNGEAIITASTSNGEFSSTVKVITKQTDQNIKISNMKLNEELITIKYGESKKIKAIITPTNATNKKITWKNNNPELISIDASGNIYVKNNKDGNATITATTDDGGFTDNVKITIKSIKNTIPVTGIKLNKSTTTLNYGNSETLIATITPSNATNKKIMWTSNNTSLVTVDNNGKINAIGNKDGKAEITAKTVEGNFIANITVNVKGIKVTGIKLDTNSTTLHYGETKNLVATITPNNASNKKIIWTSSNKDLVSVNSSGVIKAIGNKNASAEITAKTEDGSFTAKVKVNVKKIDTILETYFLNTQNLVTDYESNQSILLKTMKGNIILIDTGHRDDNIYNKIINTLKEISNTKTPVIDYFIISHSHTDHTGNLEKILKNKNIDIKNIIYKNEKWGSKQNSKTVEQIITSAKNNVSARKNMNIINTATLTKNTITYNLTSEENIKMTLFNLSDVYINNDCSKKEVYVVKFFAKSSGALKYKDKYIYLESIKPGASTLQYSSSGTIEDSNKKPEKRFYAHIKEKTSLCNANANNIAVLFEAKTNKGSKYVYIPNDLENNGYSVFGTYSESGLNQGFKYDTIYGNGTTYYYENTYKSTKSKNNSWTIKNDKFVKGINSIKKASETRVANKIRETIGESNLNNIVIYQQSHHGLNNAKDAIDTLKLNRSSGNKVYAIATNSHTGVSSNDALLARSYYYTLSNATILASGHYKYDGVYCYIKYDDSYNCSYTKKK